MRLQPSLVAVLALVGCSSDPIAPRMEPADSTVAVADACSWLDIDDPSLTAFDSCPSPPWAWMPDYPDVYHYLPLLSHDRSRVAYVDGNRLRIRELPHGPDRVIPLERMFPAHLIRAGAIWDRLRWSPYDSRQLLLSVGAYRDVDGDGFGDERVTNLFVLDVDRQSLRRIMPSAFANGATGGFANGDWLPGSTPEADSIVLYGRGTYIPQQDTIIPERNMRLITRSPSGRYSFTWEGGTVYFNGAALEPPEPIDIRTFAWSPNERYVAMEVLPSNVDSAVYSQIWIVPVDELLSGTIRRERLGVLNPQRLFCAFTVLGAYPQFLTDTSLVFTMHERDSETAYLWEVNACGRIVRRLTP